jgi:hypothetical protein
MRFDKRWWLIALTTLLMLLPAASEAQTADGRPGAQSTLRRNIAIGAIFGVPGGLVFGENVLGQRLDVPHGPDMLLGAGMGAGIGALVGAILSGGARPVSSPSRSAVSVLPVVTPSRKALLIAVAPRRP